MDSASAYAYAERMSGSMLLTLLISGDALPVMRRACEAELHRRFIFSAPWDF